jgi:aminoglycoside phosphotransferase (APT) family kinase protein
MSEPFRSLETIDQLLAAARREGLVLGADGALLDTMGLDFVVVHARDADGTPWIVRSPRRLDVVESSGREAAVLALVAPALAPVAVPSWRVHAADIIAYPRIGGTPAITIDNGTPTWHVIDPTGLSDAFLDSFARTLTALQAIDVDRASGVRIASIADERAAVTKTLDIARTLLAPKDAIWQRWQRWLTDDTMWPQHVALVHGDLHPGHMLLADDGQLTGVLDWTEARVTDPSGDLAMFYMCFGRAGLDALVARLPALGFRTWPRMVEHAIERSAVFPALGAEWAARTGNEVILEQMRAQIAELG